MTNKNHQIDSLSEEFATAEDAAKFWETHDTTDYPDAFRDVELEAAELRQRHYEVEIEPDLLDRITVNPAVCFGQPTIRGMRITVSVVLKLIASGMTHAEILAAYPELEQEDILEMLHYSTGLQR